MKKLVVALVAISSLVLTSATSVLAVTGSISEGNGCVPSNQSSNNPILVCAPGLTCQVTNPAVPNGGLCKSGGVIQVDKPTQGFATLGNAISNILTLAFAVAVLIVLVMLILGAYEWMVSGGDKEAVGKARTRIINALIGLAVLAIAFALANVFGQFVGLDLKNLTIPAPNPNASGL